MEPARYNARNVQQVVDQSRQDRGVPLDGLQRLDAFHLIKSAFEKDFDPPEDCAQRRPQLMRSRGQKLIFKPVCGLRLFSCLAFTDQKLSELFSRRKSFLSHQGDCEASNIKKIESHLFGEVGGGQQKRVKRLKKKIIAEKAAAKGRPEPRPKAAVPSGHRYGETEQYERSYRP